MNLLALAVWAGVITSSVLLIRGLRRSRPASDGRAAALHDLSETAFMAGGPANVVNVALVSLLADTRMVVGGPGIVQVRPGARANDPAERAVLRAYGQAPSGWLYQVRYAAMLDPAVQEIGDVLSDRGLITPPGTGRRWRRWGLTQATVCALMIPVSLPLTFVALALQEGSGVPFIAIVLPVLIGGIVTGLVCAGRASSRLTPAGTRALFAMRTAYGSDLSPQVRTALFGLRGLRDPYLRQQLVPAARATRLAAAQSGSGIEAVPVIWCATSDGGAGWGGSGGGGGGGSSCSGGGAGCGGSGGSGCGGGGGGGGGGSSCSSSSSGSSCSSSSGSSCSSSSSSS